MALPTSGERGSGSAHQLDPGDQLLTAGGRYATVDYISRVFVSPTLHDVTVDGIHTYLMVPVNAIMVRLVVPRVV